MTTTNGIICPAENMHLKNTKSGEIYPGYIVPAKSLTESDFTEVSEEEYQAYISTEDEISDQTLTLHADIKARLTDEQIAAVTAKNWTIA